MKLYKWEIEELLAELQEPTEYRWTACPFESRTMSTDGLVLNDYRTVTHRRVRQRHCQLICGSWFPKIKEDMQVLICPYSCDDPLYTQLQITRKVKKELRARGLEKAQRKRGE